MRITLRTDPCYVSVLENAHSVTISMKIDALLRANTGLEKHENINFEHKGAKMGLSR